jgi:hypothetical protein
MGDFGSATEGMRIIDLFALQVFAKNSDRCNFRLLQHYPLGSRHRQPAPAVRLVPTCDMCIGLAVSQKGDVRRITNGPTQPYSPILGAEHASKRNWRKLKAGIPAAQISSTPPRRRRMPEINRGINNALTAFSKSRPAIERVFAIFVQSNGASVTDALWRRDNAK